MSSDQEQPFYENRLLMIALTFVGGFLDAYTYVLKDHVFANSQTGNLVSFAINIVSGKYFRAAESGVPVFVFIFGIIVASYLKSKWPSSSFLHYSHIALIIEIILITAMSFVPANVPFLTVVGISFACAFQYSCFRKIKGVPFATTMCTGNMRSAAEFTYSFFAEGNKQAGINAFWLYFVITIFWGGSCFGTFMIKFLNYYASLICSAILFIILLVMIIHSIVLRKKNNSSKYQDLEDKHNVELVSK